MSARPLILVVDDDAPILTLMRNLLREFGFETVTAASGPAAVEELKRRRPDLVLLDRNMPGMSGEETLELLRQENAGELPILMLTGEPLEPDEIARLGVAGAVLKPFDVPSLVATIKQHVTSA
jgi:two-component system phosphate regulon response regulator PhoB